MRVSVRGGGAAEVSRRFKIHKPPDASSTTTPSSAKARRDAVRPNDFGSPGKLLSPTCGIAAVALTARGKMNRYPRRGRVSTKRGFSDESPNASRILLIAVFRL